jgi:hypothetical protein
MTKEQLEILESALSLLEDLDYSEEDYDLGSYNGKKYCRYCYCDLTFEDRRSKHKNCEYFQEVENLKNWIENEKRAD